MTIDEAIPTLTSIKKVCKGLLPPLEQDAISLGIEALERHRDQGTLTFCGIFQPLPSETPPLLNHPSDEEVKRLQESPLGREPGV